MFVDILSIFFCFTAVYLRGLFIMDWTNENVLRFIELYEMHPCIWDPKLPGHKNKTKLNDAWTDIQNNMGVPCSVKELRKKKECLMSAYRGYRSKVKKSETSGAGSGDVYRPTWFAFQAMHSFLGPIYKCNPSMNTEDEHNPQDAEDSDTNQNNTDTTNESNLEQGTSSQAPPQRDSPSQQRFKRRLHNPPELQQAKKQMDEALNILKTVSQSSQQQQRNNDDEDECQIFGRLVAKKLSKLSENRRDLLMIKINELLYTENQEYNTLNNSSTMRPNNSDNANFSSTSPPQLSISEHQNDNIPEECDTEIEANYTKTSPKQSNNNATGMFSQLIPSVRLPKRSTENTYRPNILYQGSAEHVKKYVIIKKPK